MKKNSFKKTYIRWVLELVEEPNHYIRKSGGDWGPGYGSTDDIYEAVRFNSYSDCLNECNVRSTSSIAYQWSSTKGLRPRQIKINAEIILI